MAFTVTDKEKPENSRSYLALEKEDGKMKLAGIADLRPHLHHAPDLRLAVLSGCQTAQTSGADAFSGVATGMLAADIPAVVAMQFSILDSSGIELARAFYTALAQGDTLSAAMQATRLALWQFDEGPGYDWGIPALYLRTEGMVLVDKTRPDRFAKPDRSQRQHAHQHRRAAAAAPFCGAQTRTAPTAPGVGRQPD